MKKMIIALVALTAVSTQARYLNDVDSSWSLNELQIPGIMIQSTVSPDVQGIPNAGVSGLGRTVYTSITSLCVEGGKIQTKEAKEVCTDYDFPMRRNADGDLVADRDASPVCVATDFAVLSAPIHYTAQTCATASDAAGRAWMDAHNGRRLNTDYPNCSVFKSYAATRKTSWTFNIVKKVSKNDSDYSSQYKGKLLFKKKFSLPACN